MSRSEPIESVVGQELHDDNGDVIGTREFVVDEALAAAAPDQVVHALAVLSPEGLAEMLANRVLIEQAKGMLMVIFGVDAESAFEMLKWRCQQTNVKLRLLARQLIEEFPTLTDEQPLPTQDGYERVLLTAHERIAAEPI